MKTTKNVRVAILALALCSALMTSACSTRKEIEDSVKKIAELAFFDGQRTALNGDVRIKYDAEAKCWRWAKSPWNDGTPPVTDISGIKTK